MAGTGSVERRQRVEDALTRFYEADEHGNSVQYVWASDLADVDPDLSAQIVGSYLPKIEEDSPLPCGLNVRQYTDRRGGASLWTVERVS